MVFDHLFFVVNTAMLLFNGGIARVGEGGSLVGLEAGRGLVSAGRGQVELARLVALQRQLVLLVRSHLVCLPARVQLFLGVVEVYQVNLCVAHVLLRVELLLLLLLKHTRLVPKSIFDEFQFLLNLRHLHLELIFCLLIYFLLGLFLLTLPLDHFLLAFFVFLPYLDQFLVLQPHQLVHSLLVSLQLRDCLLQLLFPRILLLFLALVLVLQVVNVDL